LKEVPVIDPRALVDKISALPIERIAEVEDFVDFLRLRDRDRALARASAQASAAAFAAVAPRDQPDHRLKRRHCVLHNATIAFQNR
jgi:hypothetical protein